MPDNRISRQLCWLVPSKMVKLHQKYFRQKIGSKNQQQKTFKTETIQLDRMIHKKIFLAAGVHDNVPLLFTSSSLRDDFV